LPGRDRPRPVAIFGPTAIGKTAIAVEVARILRRRGEEPVAVNCDSIQVYRGLEVLSGAPTREEVEMLEHRLTSFVPVQDQYSAGLYAKEAHAEIDSLGASGRRPMIVGGTGLYLRAALSELDFRPAVPTEVRQAVEQEVRAGGATALHEALPEDLRGQVHPNDIKRITRYTELLRTGQRPAHSHDKGGRLWTAPLRRPTLLIGVVADRSQIEERISRRVDQMVASGVVEEVESASAMGASRTARAAIGFEEFLAGDIDLAKARQRSFARRQETWMNKMAELRVIERLDRSDFQIAAEIVRLLDAWEA
jgi:tRNA dimethylallyltransferase